MESKLCVGCESVEVEDTFTRCPKCFENLSNGMRSYSEMLKEVSPYTAAIVAARLSADDFDNLETGWGL